MEDISVSQKNRIRQKGSWFCGTTHKLQDIENIKLNIKEFSFYAYIIHDSDIGKGLHIHFVGQVNGSRSIKSIAEMLAIDYQDVDIAKRPRGAIRYLIHIDDKDKYQYKFSDVITNNKDRLEYYFINISNSINDIYFDFKALKVGSLSVDDFVRKYSSEFSALPFYQKIKTLEVIDKISIVR